MLIRRSELVDGTDMKKKEFGDFKPAGMAFHRSSGLYYVISSVDRRLVALRSDGSVAGSHTFARKMLRQPEGIAFGRDGSLFLASEGDGKRAVVLRFRPARTTGAPARTGR